MDGQYLNLKKLGIDTYQEPTVYMRADSHVCRAEGFNAQARIRIITEKNSIVATLNIVSSNIIAHNEAGLSDIAWQLLNATDGEKASFRHAKPVESMSYVRKKLAGHPLTNGEAHSIIQDINDGRYSDIQIAAFACACVGDNLSLSESIAITKAMVDCGRRFRWLKKPIMDKHCVGGLPGNRTTPIVVAIVTACGLIMPKTSSRAITSPAGTADTMEVMTNVTLTFEQMKKVVEKEGGCLAWGGSVALSPTDDTIIRVERALDLDSVGQLVASVLSKKIAAGSTDVLIDIPVGPTAKIRTHELALSVSEKLTATGKALGLNVRTLCSDGTQPVGFGIGPALEARDILAVLRQQPDAPTDLQARSLTLAAEILEMGGIAKPGEGMAMASQTLISGAALEKFQAICLAQGRFSEPPKAQYTHTIHADRTGIVSSINCRFIARLAKLAGAPAAKAAGLEMHVKLGDNIETGARLFTLHAEAPGELEYVLDFNRTHQDAIQITEELV